MGVTTTGRSRSRRSACNDGVGVVLPCDGWHALDMDGEVGAGRFDLALFE